MAAVVVAIVVLVLLAAALTVGALRRRDTDVAVGMLSRETIKHDRRSAEAVLGAPTKPPTGRSVERAAALERHRAATAIEPAPTRAPAPWTPPDPDVIGVTRRQFFNRSIVVTMIVALSGFGASMLAFLWPQSRGGFGSKIAIGSIDDILAEIDKAKGFYYRSDARMWLTRYPSGSIEKARATYTKAELVAIEAGVVPLYQKCPHLGCRVPNCQTSQWFECPCHGSQYNRVGEKRGGPAPRGMDRFATSISGNVLTVDTGTIIQGPPIGTNTTGQEPEGPHCVSGGGG